MIDDQRQETGAALFLALLVTLLLAALGGGLILVGDTEAALASHHRAAGEVRYAADAALERALTEIRVVAAWTSLLNGSVRSPVFSSSALPLTPWGASLDLAVLTAQVQAESAVTYGTGLNAPAWRVYASGSLDAAAGSPLPAAPAYLVVWIADDVGETDNDALSDTNEAVLIRALAVNAVEMRAVAQATVQRVGGSLRVLAWRIVE